MLSGPHEKCFQNEARVAERQLQVAFKKESMIQGSRRQSSLASSGSSLRVFPGCISAAGFKDRRSSPSSLWDLRIEALSLQKRNPVKPSA